MKKVSINNFADEMAEMIKAYTTDMEQGMEDEKERVAKGAVKTLKSTSPVGKRKRRRRYYQGWRAKKVGTAWIVHNATDYQLTHLLEKGHAKVGGGRVRAYPHIGPVEDKVIIGLEKGLEKIAKGR